MTSARTSAAVRRASASDETGNPLRSVAAQGDGLAVELTGICKSFYGSPANVDVDFALRRGEVHALLGENGAGKSTLCSVLAGLYQPEAGRIVVDGELRRFRSPNDALGAGVGMVYQHYRLVAELTVAENLALGHAALGFRLTRRALEARAREVMARYGMEVPVSAYVGELSVGEQQRVEILKLLAREVNVLILDEPTAVLTPQESEVLFAAIRAMASEGKAIVFISHKLGEVLAVCDRVTVLRRGALVGSIDAGRADRHALARMMVGEEAAVDVETEGRRPAALVHRAAPPADAPRVLSVRDLRVLDDRGREAVAGLELHVRAGELLGVAGVAGNGQRELAEAVTGLRELEAGEVRIGGQRVRSGQPRDAIEHGMAYVPQDRLAVGLAPGLSIADNLILKAQRNDKEIASGPILLKSKIQARTREMLERFDIRGASEAPVGSLSGGNAQKVILARELSCDPQVVVAESPTRGLDVGAIASVRRTLLEAAERGVAILLVSEDLDEVLDLADRVAVMYGGRIVGVVEAEGADHEQLGLMMAGIAA